MSQLPLFPEMERVIRDDRLAERRERVQHARQWLKQQNLSWLINRLLDAPATGHKLISEVMDDHFHADDFMKDASKILTALYALWLTKKAWRKAVGPHPGSGEMSYTYGLRRVHNPK